MNEWELTNQRDRLIDDCSDVLDDLKVWLGYYHSEALTPENKVRPHEGPVLEAAIKLQEAVHRAQE